MEEKDKFLGKKIIDILSEKEKNLAKFIIDVIVEKDKNIIKMITYMKNNPFNKALIGMIAEKNKCFGKKNN